MDGFEVLLFVFVLLAVVFLWFFSPIVSSIVMALVFLFLVNWLSIKLANKSLIEWFTD